MEVVFTCPPKVKGTRDSYADSPISRWDGETLTQQLQRIHQQTVRTADGQALHGLTEMTPAQKSLFTALQLPIPTPAALSLPVL